MISLRFAFFIIGALLVILAMTMVAPALVDFAAGDRDWKVFLASSATSAFLGGALVLTCRQREIQFSRHTGYLVTAGSWVFVTAFGSLPLLYSSLHIGITDAVFETMSALTTTGSTVLTGLDTMPKGILLWRSLMQWIGGLGIVAMAIILLPFLRIGGMQLFLTESSTIGDKGMARFLHFAVSIALAYVVLTCLCATALVFAGMNVFDAVNHAMAALATGGFSTKDASVGFYNSVPIEVVLTVFMAAGALPLAFYVHAFRRGWQAMIADAQVPTFIGVLLGSIAVMTLWLWMHNGMAWESALRVSAFNVTSVLTDTGFGTADFSQWGSFPVGLLFVLMLVGGCAGSTAGSIKIFRWQILWKGAHAHLEQTLSPSKVHRMRYAGAPVPPEMLASVRNFFFLYLLTLGAISLALMATGMDFLGAFSAVAQAMANAGPGLTPQIGPAGNFAAIPATAKWLLVLAMLLGRLELATVYVLVLRSFWIW